MRTSLRAGMKTPFTRKMWDRWLARMSGPDEADPQYCYLKAGIAHFRQLCAEREKGPT